MKIWLSCLLHIIYMLLQYSFVNVHQHWHTKSIPNFAYSSILIYPHHIINPTDDGHMQVWDAEAGGKPPFPKKKHARLRCLSIWSDDTTPWTSPHSRKYKTIWDLSYRNRLQIIWPTLFLCKEPRYIGVAHVASNFESSHTKASQVTRRGWDILSHL